ncbi:MAG: hypothetical protein ACFFBY_02675 [Promethearchaeota archaeon]
MEIDYNEESSGKPLNNPENNESIINVRAILSCPSCGYKKKFKNQFPRDQLELLVVAVKIFDFMTCTCGELIKLDLEFNL